MKTPVLWLDGDFLTLDPNLPRARAVVTFGENITFVGDEQNARTVAGRDATVVSLSGQTVVPGFNDNHLHLVIYGDHTFAPDLTGLNEQEIVARVVAFAPSVRPGSPIVAYGWDYDSCPRPRKELLDEAFPDRLVALAQFGGHGLWVNSAVLRSMGIDRSHSPSTGQVLRDEDGEPIGILLEVTKSPIAEKHFHDMFYKTKLREPRVQRALDQFRRHGITSVQDNTWYAPVLTTLQKLRRRKQLTTRVRCWSLGREPSTLPAMARGRYTADWITQGPRKYFLDGTFTTRTAWMDEPYADTPNEHGMGFDEGWLGAVLQTLAKKNLQGAFHSIGDRSTAVFLDAWERVLDRYPEAVRLRMRLEHVQLVRPSDFERMHRLGVCAAVQPPALCNPQKDQALLGHKRALRCYPHRSLLDAGVPLSFGSDIPGESFFEPLRGMHLVCNRAGPERLEPLEALRAYTQGSAFVEFQEHRKGMLRAGMLADFAVLSADPTAVDPLSLRDVTVTQTVVGGRTVWQRPPTP